MDNAGTENPSKPFSNPTVHITTHDETTRKAVIHSSVEAEPWFAPRGTSVTWHVPYTTSSFPVSLTNGSDITTHQELMARGELGLVNPGGTVLRIVDFGPGHEALMHRTQSLDYGIVLEGEIYMDLDGGETKLLKRGDIAIQRGTMHAWRAVDPSQWTRMLFVLQDSQPIEVGGQRFKEDLGTATGKFHGSGNDV